jgi:chemotaxis protein MotB
MAWLTTFNDLMTLLMVFFVLMFSMGTIDSRKIKKFQHTLQSGLGMLLAGKEVKVGVIEPLVRRIAEDNRTVEELIEDLKKDYHELSGSDSETDSIEDESLDDSSLSDGDKPERTPGRVDHALDALTIDPDIKVTYTEKGARVTLENKILFKLGIADINPEGLPTLDKIIRVIEKSPNPARVEGHTDNIPIHTEKFPSNWELSVARAVNVVKYFIEGGGIDPGRLSAVGYGDSRPLYPDDSQEARARNRRVEIVIVKNRDN